MYCQNCGKELAPGAASCGACGAGVPGHPTGGEAASLSQLLEETRRAARDLAQSSAELTKRLASRADAVRRDPKGSAKKAVDRAAKELDAAAHEVERILKDL
jgi:ABC-type transporter Mla subunit MlaD